MPSVQPACAALCEGTFDNVRGCHARHYVRRQRGHSIHSVSLAGCKTSLSPGQLLCAPAEWDTGMLGSGGRIAEIVGAAGLVIGRRRRVLRPQTELAEESSSGGTWRHRASSVNAVNPTQERGEGIAACQHALAQG
jgi:hypothetical protein